MNWLSHHTLSNEDSWHARNTINPSAGRKEWNFPSNLIFELTFQHPELMIKCALQEPFCAEKQQTITPGDKRPCCPPGLRGLFLSTWARVFFRRIPGIEDTELDENTQSHKKNGLSRQKSSLGNSRIVFWFFYLIQESSTNSYTMNVLFFFLSRIHQAKVADRGMNSLAIDLLLIFLLRNDV